MTRYERELTHKLFTGSLTKAEIKEIEHTFIKEISKYEFIYLSQEYDEEFKQVTSKVFKNRIYKNINLLLMTFTAVDEYEGCKYTSWGQWNLCNDEGEVLHYFSDKIISNIMLLEGHAVGCYGFWLEGTEKIPEFIKQFQENSKEN